MPHRVHLFVFVVICCLLAVASSPAVEAQATPMTFTGYIPRSGVSLVVSDQSGAPSEVIAGLGQSGCLAVSIAIAERGRFQVYVPGAPGYANASFPTFLSPGTPLAIRCRPAPTTVTPTVVTHFVPALPPEATAQDGSCFASSLALGGRADAWRCSVEHAIYDPCFELPGGPLVCGANPTIGESGFVLNLAAPLPPPDLFLGDVEGAARNGWLVELDDGTVCSFNTGATAGINGHRANYGCPGGTWLLGDLMAATPWTAVSAEIDVTEDGYRLGAAREVVIAHVWQEGRVGADAPTAQDVVVDRSHGPAEPVSE